MSTANWRKYSVKRILKAVEGCGGNITVVCKRLGCARDTLVKAMRESQEIADAMKSAEEEFGDLVESQIAKQIKEGNTTMTIFYAKTKLKKRGYIEANITFEGEKVPMVVDDIPEIEHGNPDPQPGSKNGSTGVA